MFETQSQFRSFIAVDLENLVGKPRIEVSDVTDVLEQLQMAFRIESTDHVVIGTNPGNAFAAEFARRRLHGSIRIRHGHNGADLELIDALEVFLKQDFKRRTPLTHRVVVCSGDGIFADVASWARDVMRLDVMTITQADRLSRRLEKASTEVRYLSSVPKLAFAS